MIPKIIHCCWFGRGEKTLMMQKCIKSWKKYCPDYEIIEWNEDNFDINSTLWTKQAYDAKKYAFVSDYVRLFALQKYGGVYMDTDQELIKSLDPFLVNDMFLGFKDSEVNSGLIGASSESKMLGECLQYYHGREFDVDGKYDQTPNTKWITEIFISHGLKIRDEHQKIKDAAVYPRTYFCPTTCDAIHKSFSSSTVAIHHWAMSWRTEKEMELFRYSRLNQNKWYKTYIFIRYLPNRIVRRLFGDESIDRLKKSLNSFLSRTNIEK